jgi:hypothetical protein
VVERNPTDFELRLSMGTWIYVICPVEDTGKYIKDSIDK